MEPLQGSIYPITARVPATLDKGYLKQQLIPCDLIERIRGRLLFETAIWSIDESARIASGKGRPVELQMH
ncbi:hypothetical protein [Thermogemmatispora sp.]|uniref:hypothetical protein n=1 Tax=Thermogemmatispora sp. TaxID=1968838 RepID=UPI001DCBE422|nr:hypothetical protein [Thermogemmatispora sp.]MBX5449376.1 hypothetical protein [Thermogemmatispora sp.]